MLRTRLLVALCVLALPGLLLAPVWTLAGLGAGEDDVLYYLPMRAYFAQLVEAGHWPWLNPWTGLGRPYAADPQTALAYPFTWLFATLPPLQAYPLVLWAHYSLALWGMYRLLRLQALEPRAALFGGIAFAFSGFMLAHRAHFTMQQAAAWTPWVFWALLRYAGPGNPALAAHRSRRSAAAELVFAPGARDPRDVRRLAIAGLLTAMPCLAGHVQVAALLALGSLVFLLVQPAPSLNTAWRFRLRVVLRWFVTWVCAAGVFAVQWLPTVEYLRQCTRTGRAWHDFVENSWHPLALVSWLMPMLLGQRTPNFFGTAWWGPRYSHQVELFAYAGVVPLLLAALSVRVAWREDPRRRAWLLLGLFALLVALGEYGPLCPILYFVPGSSLFRCPARALLLVNLALAALAASALHDLGAATSPKRDRLRALALDWTARPIWLAAGLLAAPLVYLLVCLPFVDAAVRTAAGSVLRPWNPAIWVPAALILSAILLLSVVARQWRRPGLLWLLSGLTALDLGVIGWTIDVPAQHAAPETLVAPADGADWLDRVRASGSRLWVVNARVQETPGEYVQPLDKAVANTNVLRGIPSLTDYGPFQPKSIVQRFGFKPWGETDEAARLLESTRWMRWYNVGWVLVCGELPAPADCELVTTTPQGWRLYECPSAGAAAMFESPSQPGVVRCVPRSPYEIVTPFDSWPMPVSNVKPREAATRRGTWPLLVLSQVALPGWTARLKKEELTIEPVDGVLLGVRVPPGEAGEVVWTYAPPGLQAGALISVLTVGVLIAALLWSLAPRAGRG